MTITGLNEVFIPASDLKASASFYEKLGYKKVNELPWGMIQLKAENNMLISLVKKDFFPEISLSHFSDDIDKDFNELLGKGLEVVEDERKNEPSRFTLKDPEGFEITVIGV
jgi:predicted enzyme related to lactoylglutathione lyase